MFSVLPSTDKQTTKVTARFLPETGKVQLPCAHSREQSRWHAAFRSSSFGCFSSSESPTDMFLPSRFPPLLVLRMESSTPLFCLTPLTDDDDDDDDDRARWPAFFDELKSWTPDPDSFSVPHLPRDRFSGGSVLELSVSDVVVVEGRGKKGRERGIVFRSSSKFKQPRFNSCKFQTLQ